MPPVLINKEYTQCSRPLGAPAETRAALRQRRAGRSGSIGGMSEADRESHLKDLLYQKHKTTQKLGVLASQCRMIHTWLPKLLEQFSDPHLSQIALSTARSNFDQLVSRAKGTDVIGLVGEAIETASEIEALRNDINASNGIIDS